MNTWYSEKNMYQGLVIDEKTGKNIAVSYEPKDAVEIATLHNLVEQSLIPTLEFLIKAVQAETGGLYSAHLYIANQILDTLKELQGEENG